MSGGKGGGKQTVTQQVAIPDFLRPFVTQQAQVGSDALTALQGKLTGAGAAELVAPMTADQRAAIDRARALATDPNGALRFSAQNLRQIAETGAASGPGGENLLATARGDFLFGSDASKAAVDAAVRAAMPSIISTFGGAGRGTGGLAQAAIAQQATDAFARQFGDERTRQLAAASELANRQLAATGALPGAATAGISLLSDIGNRQQAQAQQELTAPISAIEALLQGAGGGVPLASLLGSSQRQSGGGGNIGAGVLGGGALGLGLGAMTAAEGATGLAALGGPLGIGLGLGGALLGGLLG